MKAYRTILSVVIATGVLAPSVAEAQTVFTQTGVFNVPEANQGVAVDKFFF